MACILSAPVIPGHSLFFHVARSCNYFPFYVLPNTFPLWKMVFIWIFFWSHLDLFLPGNPWPRYGWWFLAGPAGSLSVAFTFHKRAFLGSKKVTSAFTQGMWGQGDLDSNHGSIAWLQSDDRWALSLSWSSIPSALHHVDGHRGADGPELCKVPCRP